MTYYIEPPADLLEKILLRVHRERRLFILKRIIIFSITLAGSAVGFIPAVKMLLSDFNHSGFLQFSALVFSDFSTMAAHWNSFLLTLAQTLPVISLAMVSVALLIFLQSAVSLVKNIKILNHGTA